MKNESVLNSYYNQLGLNRPNVLGCYAMDTIRKVTPLTEEEWRDYFLTNVQNEDFIEDQATILCKEINKDPKYWYINIIDCREYIEDVLFRRTFEGYDKEKKALRILNSVLPADVKEAPKEWDTEYFIDFFCETPKSHLLGIQLKPVSFAKGHYDERIDIKGKMERFCKEQRAKAGILFYEKDNSRDGIKFSNPKMINKMQEILTSGRF